MYGGGRQQLWASIVGDKLAPWCTAYYRGEQHCTRAHSSVSVAKVILSATAAAAAVAHCVGHFTREV